MSNLLVSMRQGQMGPFLPGRIRQSQIRVVSSSKEIRIYPRRGTLREHRKRRNVGRVLGTEGDREGAKLEGLGTQGPRGQRDGQQ